MPTIDAHIIQKQLELLMGILGGEGKVAVYTDLAERLSKVAGRNGKDWSWRYVQSVHVGTVAPSKRFARAVEVLAAEIDGLPPFIAETEAITVYARPGSVRSNAIVLSESKPCANPACTIHFIPRVPWQKYCPRCRRKVSGHDKAK